ncbi:MAG: hypothetical protein GY701_31605 [Sulfitobacter sp.]|nr:hypothetical protein [Sulfitobacter sp.]MCP4087030.1 hypothetical protein [Actinomycetes bacterium]
MKLSAVRVAILMACVVALAAAPELGPVLRYLPPILVILISSSIYLARTRQEQRDALHAPPSAAPGTAGPEPRDARGRLGVVLIVAVATVAILLVDRLNIFTMLSIPIGVTGLVLLNRLLR